MKIIVDTENYAGNFERELVVFVTGQQNEYTRFEQDLPTDEKYLKWWETNLTSHGKIHPTDGWFNNGMGKHYRDLPENEEIAQLECRDSWIEYNKPHRARIQTMLDTGNFVSNWTAEGCKRELKSYDEKEQLKPLVKYPAYLSVKFSTAKKMPKEIETQFRERLNEFSKREKITITGIRFK